jgi:hypothetical protein
MKSPEVFEQALNERLQRRPFQPFVIEIINGELFTISKPEALWYPLGGPSAVFFHADGNFDFVNWNGVQQIRDCPLAASA